MAQFESPLGTWNYGQHGMSEHNPDFDWLVSQIYTHDTDWIFGTGVMYNERTKEKVEHGSLFECMLYVYERDIKNG